MKKTILIADDNPDIVDLLSSRCTQLGLDVQSADNAMTVLQLAEQIHPAVVILDVNMPKGNGLSVCEMLSTHTQLQDTPVIILTGNSSTDILKRCHEMCAYYVPKAVDVWSRIEPLLCELLDLPSKPAARHKPSDESNETVDLLDRVFAILGVESGDLLAGEDNGNTWEADGQPWVLSIEDDEDMALALKMRLREVGIETVHVSEGRSGYYRAFSSPPNAIILDYELPEGNGDYVLRRLKETPATSNIPVIVLTGRREGYIERQMRGMGASAFFTKPFNWELLKEALGNLVDTNSTSV